VSGGEKEQVGTTQRDLQSQGVGSRGSGTSRPIERTPAPSRRGQNKPRKTESSFRPKGSTYLKEGIWQWKEDKLKNNTKLRKGERGRRPDLKAEGVYEGDGLISIKGKGGSVGTKELSYMEGSLQKQLLGGSRKGGGGQKGNSAYSHRKGEKEGNLSVRS